MSSKFLQLHADGTVSTEDLPIVVPVSDDTLSEATMLQIADERQRLTSAVDNIENLQQVALSLEAFGDTLSVFTSAAPLTPDQTIQLESLATVLSQHVLHTPVCLTKNGVYSAESLVSNIKSIFAAVLAGIKKLIIECGRFLARTSSLTGNLRRQLRTALAEVKALSPIDTPMQAASTVAIAALADDAGNFDPVVAQSQLSALRDQVKWLVNIHAPETVNFIVQISGWLGSLNVDSDVSLLRTFDAIREIKVPTGMSNWKLADMTVENGMIAKTSLVGFTNHCFIEITPNGLPAEATDYLDRAVMRSGIQYGYREDTTVVFNDDSILLPSTLVIRDMVSTTIELCDYHEIFRNHSTRLTKALEGLMVSSEALMRRGANASMLNESSMAKLVLAIQSTQAIALRAHQPFGDLLYETLRIITGIVSLAGMVKIAHTSGE